MYSLNSEYNIRNGYDITHIPEILPLYESGMILFGEDPGSIIDEEQYIDDIEKLTR